MKSRVTQWTTLLLFVGLLLAAFTPSFGSVLKLRACTQKEAKRIVVKLPEVMRAIHEIKKHSDGAKTGAIAPQDEDGIPENIDNVRYWVFDLVEIDPNNTEDQLAHRVYTFRVRLMDRRIFIQEYSEEEFLPLAAWRSKHKQ